MKILAFILAVLLCLPSQGAAQTATQSTAAQETQKPDADPTTAKPPSGDSPAINPASYVIGRQDQLTITVIGEPDLSGPFTVDDGGGITFPYVGRLTAAGLTVTEFQERLKGML